MITAITTLVVIVRNPILLEGILLLIKADPRLLLLASATTAEDGLALFSDKQPDCVLLDLDMPSASSLFAAETMLKADCTTKIIGLATYELDVCVSRALQLGVCAVIGKDQISQALTDTILRTSGSKYFNI